MRTIVFIHGAWVTPLCWERFIPYFEERGYRCIAPARPGKDRPIEEIRRDPSALAGLGVGEIVARYEQVVRGLDEPPILVGHSCGGLFTQILLDRGRGWRKAVRWSFARFRYAFVHSLPPDAQRAAYDRHVTPETGRVFFQGAFSLSPGSPCRVDFGRSERAPLLIVAGAADKIVPASVVRRTHAKYARSTAVTDYVVFAGRTHWIIAQDGWEEVAGRIEDWLGAQGVSAVAAADAPAAVVAAADAPANPA